MKRKGERDIPDFLHARPAHATHPSHPTPAERAPAPRDATRTAARTPMKPQATSAKSGRRGQ